MPGATTSAAPVLAPVDVPSGLTLEVVGTDDDSSKVLAAAVDGFAAAHGAHVVHREAGDDVEGAVDAATAAAPDLVVGLGADVVDGLDPVSAQHLDQQYLVLGAQLPEPTENVTAVVWTGATSRGSAAAADGPLTAVTVARAEQAVAAGVDRWLTEGSGSVVDLG